MKDAEGFATSAELKNFFNQQLELWKKKNRSTLDELAALCGVTPSYLSQVGRYGRIPGKPVLLLLGFNFELANPQLLFDAAGISDAWPYNSSLRLTEPLNEQAGFLSLKLDMQGFTAAIREIVKAETRPRSIRELLGKRPLRVGFNLLQSWCFESSHPRANLRQIAGFYPELFKILAMSLQVPYELVAVNFRDAFTQLGNGELDIYGPVYSTPRRIGLALYSEPFCQVGISLIWRKRPSDQLPTLKKPKHLEELKALPYHIGVLRESNTDHFALSHLEGGTCNILRIETVEEQSERLTYSGIAGQVHCSLCDSMIAEALCKKFPDLYEHVLAEDGTPFGFSENTIAVRPDMEPIATVLDQALNFMQREKTLASIFQRQVPADTQPLIHI